MQAESNSQPAASTGLDSAEAARRLARSGPNELPRSSRRGVARILLGVLSEPIFLMLVLAAGIYLAIGSLGEGLLMSGFAGLTIVLVVVQEKRSEDALEALRALATPSARVLRDGREQRISSRDVVPGDLLFIADGERVAADAMLLRAENVLVDESLLTGESVPVPKRADATGLEESAGNMVYASTLVATGRGLARVLRTGKDTEAGKIGVSLATIEVEKTLLQKSFGRLIKMFSVIAVIAGVCVGVLYAQFHHDWLQGALSGIALGMSALPEELPMVLVVFVALGARRLARMNVLVHRTAVVEVLGACSTLCVDKTGTLTENRMRVCGMDIAGERLDAAEAVAGMPARFVELLRLAADASAHTSNDPIDAAIHRLAAGITQARREGDEPALVREYGFTQDRPAVVRVWRSAEGLLQAAAKGAPETIADFCRLAESERAALMRSAESYAQGGIRVLAVASARPVPATLPSDPADLGLELAGLVAFADPLRPSARDAVRLARKAGVSVVMITGDHPATALAIAREAGIDCSAPAATGADVATADDATLARLLRSTRVFARVRPDQKLRLVRAFKDNGEVVAMTGDGVNDAPALRAAHIGLAMGKHGTDVAREAASIVLLEDDLGHLVDGIEMGRRIFDNLRKAAIYIAAIHVPICGLALLPLLMGLPPLLLPLHVVLIQMVIDPICAIAFEMEPVEPGIMEQPPRRPGELLLGLPQLVVAGAQGLLLLGVVLGIYVAGIHSGQATNLARTLAFVAFTAGNLTLIRVAATRGWTLGRLFSRDLGAYWAVAVVSVAVVAACVGVPSLQRLFQFEAPPFGLAALSALLGIASALSFDCAKLFPSVQSVLGRSTHGREAPA